MEPRSSLPYPEPGQYILCPNPTCWRSILVLSCHLCRLLPRDLFPPGFPMKTLHAHLLTPCVLHNRPIPFFLIWTLYLGPKEIGEYIKKTNQRILKQTAIKHRESLLYWKVFVVVTTDVWGKIVNHEILWCFEIRVFDEHI